MKTVHKYPFYLSFMFQLSMPAGAEILMVEDQDRVPCIWALVDPSASFETRTFRLYGTGYLIENSGPLKHRGSFQQGRSVWHLFEAIPLSEADLDSLTLGVTLAIACDMGAATRLVGRSRVMDAVNAILASGKVAATDDERGEIADRVLKKIENTPQKS